ncbi:hypothetical protein B0T25DRAFT_592887 [Lasiosphaeria hispida]|uniref:Uncharacterized protein n=1 Tax=Lasiosphaeria hispida TaxID=260671 RepID=A0AAJ0HC48_9PEZI|nr:hypothetical protein B0T25DRAFT_592887 [Lasiosphaeria hispida]
MAASLGSARLCKAWAIFLLVTVAHLNFATATLWTVTSYIAVSVQLDVNPTATPTARPVSSSTSIENIYDVTVVYLYVPADKVPDSDLITTTTSYKRGVATYYQQPIIYTAPSSCPTPFTFSTYTNVYVLLHATQLVTPTSTASSIYTPSTGTGDGKYTYITLYLPPSAVPLTRNPATDFVYTYYISNCRNPTATGAAYYGPDSDLDSGSSDLVVCSVLTGCTGWRVWVIVVATILPTLFLSGFLSSWFWLRRLMLGKGALRFGTVCWCLITLWIMCFTRHSPARTAQDQEVLKQRWAAIDAGTRVKLWFKWGFRHAYPVHILGPDPRDAATSATATATMPPGQGQPPPPNGGRPPYYPRQPPYPGSDKTGPQDQVLTPTDQTPTPVQQLYPVYAQPYLGQPRTQAHKAAQSHHRLASSPP